MKANQASSIKIEIQFWVIIIISVMSFFLKSYREDVCNNFEDDPINDKLEEIKQRYQLTKLKPEELQKPRETEPA